MTESDEEDTESDEEKTESDEEKKTEVRLQPPNSSRRMAPRVTGLILTDNQDDVKIYKNHLPCIFYFCKLPFSSLCLAIFKLVSWTSDERIHAIQICNGLTECY